MMKRQLNRASTLPANKIVPPVARRPPQRSTTQANMGSVDENGGASATASVVVVARIRPKLPKEDKEPDGVEVYSDAQTLSIFNNGREKKQYTLDQVFDSRWRMQTARSARSNDSLEKSPRPSAAEQRKAEAAESQAKFFNDFGRNLVTHSLKGYNVCVFAYGHTGSGKTYTMLGDAAGSGRGAAAGLLPRFLIELFQEHEDAPRPDTWRCSCEFFEVYNEQIRDLLQPNAQVQKPKRVHCHPKHGARIEGLTMSVVSSAEEVMELLHFGNQMRTVAATTMNSRSSRSHAFFNFKYEQIGEEPPEQPGPPPPPQARGKERRVTIAAPDPPGGGSCMSAVTFVDLAGREERERLGNHPGAMQYKEMCFINTSLFHLAHLITKISQGGLSNNNLSDFRNSKVTMLLSQALQGNSRTAVVATLSPCQSAFEDSMSTLNFAASAKKIQTKPVVNSKSATEKLAELENEVHSLQVELAQSKTSNTEKEQELLSAQAWINYYKRSWEEACARSEQTQKARTRSAKRLGLTQSGRTGSVASLFAATKSMKSEVSEADEEEEQLYPFLTKLCDDPALQGCCNFPLDQEQVQIGSCEGNCDIVLMGVGITSEMCSVHCEKGEVSVEALKEEGGSTVRVLLNGKMLQPDEPEKMKHGDCLILGYSHAFRLVEPTPERVKQAGSSEYLQVARSTVPKLDVSSAFEEAVCVEGKQLEDSGDKVSAFSFINNLSNRASASTVKSFLSALHHVHPLVEEANVITREVFGNAELHLEIHTLTDVLDFQNDAPEIVICCLEKPSPLSRFQQTVNTVQQCLRDPNAPTSSQDLADKRWMLGKAKHPLAHAMGLDEHMSIRGHGHLLSIFSLEDFLQRLSEIRDIYQEACETGEGFEAMRSNLAAHPFQNPWHQSSFTHTKVLADEAASIRTSPLLRWLLRSPPKAPIQQAPPPGASLGTTIAQAPVKELQRRPSIAESVQSANSSGHLFPVDIRASQDKDKQSPTPRTGQTTNIFEVDNSPIPSLGSYLKALLTDTSSADILLAVMEPGEGQESTLVHAHSIVLSRLPFFHRLIADHKAMGKSPIIVPHALSVCILRQLLVYAYTDSAKEATANLSPNMLRQLQKAASNCSMPELCKACMNKLSGTESASESSSAKAPGGPSSPGVRRRISRGSSQQKVREISGRDLPVLLSKKSSLSDSSQGGSLKLRQQLRDSKQLEAKVAEGKGASDAGSSRQMFCMESGSSMSSSPLEGRDGDQITRQHSAVRLSSGSLRAFAEEMAELRRLLLAHPRAQGQEIPKRATDLLEDLQSSMMETIRSEFRGCLKEAGDKIGQGDSASLTSLASGITSQIHHLRDDLICMLNSDGSARAASRSPVRVRDESPVPSMPIQPVPLARVTSPPSGFSTEPVVRTTPPPFDHRAATPPLGSPLLVATPGAPKIAGAVGAQPLQRQRLVIHASTGQLPRPATRSPSPNSSCCMVPAYAGRTETRSVSPIPGGSYWQMNAPSRPGWGTAPGPVSVRFNRPRMNHMGSSGTSSTLTTNRSWQNLQEPVTANPVAISHVTVPKQPTSTTSVTTHAEQVDPSKAVGEKAPVETLRL
ncbi:unnamed protein product [Durusdinium trenchii]|uniref:Kinesin motor domain-containing protein n=1 Tax=Durusdinium trenchii TaxID=1381693 RepID=A0ABP0NWX5_9DINO